MRRLQLVKFTSFLPIIKLAINYSNVKYKNVSKKSQKVHSPLVPELLRLSWFRRAFIRANCCGEALFGSWGWK